MEYSENSSVIISLCGSLHWEKGNLPLEAAEWSMLAKRLYAAKLQPKDLSEMDRGEFTAQLGLEPFWAERVFALLLRRSAIGYEIERLARKNIYLVTRADPEYPAKLKERLLAAAPPFFYCAGDISLCKSEGIAVTGSRKLDGPANDFALEAAVKAAKEEYTLCSGGADGTDNITEPAVLKLGGKVVSYLAGSMEYKLNREDVMEKVLSGKLLLMSVIRPDTLFLAENAPPRNKYIYASSSAAFLVSSDNNKGVAWEGAAECLRAGWVPVFARITDTPKGNSELIKMGAMGVDDLSRHTVEEWKAKYRIREERQQTSLFGFLE